MALKFKRGISLRHLQPQLVVALQVATELLDELENKDCIVTSGSDGDHGVNSLHYTGLAVDIRIHHLKNPTMMAEAIRATLPEEFDVVLENLGKPNEHIHIEYQP